MRDIEHGFPFLPAGTQIVLDRQTQELVLENIRSQVTSAWKQITAELRAHPTTDLRAFLEESGVELSDVIRSDRSWTRLRRDAGISVPEGGARETALLKTGARLRSRRRPRTCRRLSAVAVGRGPVLRRGRLGTPGLRAHAVLLAVARRRRFHLVCRGAGCASQRAGRARGPARRDPARPGER